MTIDHSDFLYEPQNVYIALDSKELHVTDHIIYFKKKKKNHQFIFISISLVTLDYGLFIFSIVMIYSQSIFIIDVGNKCGSTCHFCMD